MSAIHGVEGLIKWIKGDEWRNDFEAVFDRHVGPACRGAGVELEELADIIGDHGMTVLWGCAFEDFVSSGSGERNVADEYLKRRGWKESAGAERARDGLREWFGGADAARRRRGAGGESRSESVSRAAARQSGPSAARPRALRNLLLALSRLWRRRRRRRRAARVSASAVLLRRGAHGGAGAALLRHDHQGLRRHVRLRLPYSTARPVGDHRLYPGAPAEPLREHGRRARPGSGAMSAADSIPAPARDAQPVSNRDGGRDPAWQGARSLPPPRSRRDGSRASCSGVLRRSGHGARPDPRNDGRSVGRRRRADVATRLPVCAHFAAVLRRVCALCRPRLSVGARCRADPAGCARASFSIAPLFAVYGLIALVGWAVIAALLAAGRLGLLGVSLALVFHGVAISAVASLVAAFPRSALRRFRLRRRNRRAADPACARRRRGDCASARHRASRTATSAPCCSRRRSALSTLAS